MVAKSMEGLTLEQAVASSMISSSEAVRVQVTGAVRAAEVDPSLFYMYTILMLGDIRGDLNSVLECLMKNNMITIEDDDDAPSRA